MKSYISILIVFFIVLNIYSQSNLLNYFNVKGTVLDSISKQPLEFSTVTFTNNSHNKEIPLGTIVDKNGHFKLRVPQGIYTVAITFLSYKPIKLKDVYIYEDVNFDTFYLALQPENLEEIEVIGTNKSVVSKLDRLIYFIGKDLTVTGGSALNALKNIPNISINSDGGVSLRNDPNVVILINGKQSIQGTSELLNNISVETIEKVEIITVPSSKFSAQGTAGLINITLKKGANSGLNSSVSLSGGNPEYYGAAINLNFKLNKLTIHNTSGYLERKTPGNAFIYNKQFANNSTTGFYEDTRNYNRNKSVFNSNLGIDYELTESSVFSTAATLNIVNGDNFTTNYSSLLDSNKNQVSIQNLFEKTAIDDDLIEFSFNYFKAFKTEGHQLNIYYIIERQLENKLALYNNTEVFPTVQNLLNKDLKIGEDISVKNQLFGFDYSLPFGKKSMLELGYEGATGLTSNDYQYNNFNSTNLKFELNSDFSNFFEYKEIIHSLYSRLESSFGKLTISAGLRVEISDVDHFLKTTISKNHYDKTDYFPSSHISYELNDSNNLTFSYGKRIFRPTYWYLNPFETKLSETNIVVGNPFLEAFFSDLYEFKHLKTGNKLSLNSSIYIKDYTNAPERITYSTGLFVNGVSVEKTTYKNIASLHQVGFEHYTTYNPLKWLSLSGGFNIYNSKQEGSFSYNDATNTPKTIDFSSDDISGYGSFNIKLKIQHDWNLQSTYKYYAPSKGAISTRKEYSFVDFAISKNFLKNKATITFNFSDVFNSNAIEREINTESTFTKSRIQWNEPSFILNFTYRFNKNSKNPAKEIDKDKMIMF